MLFELFRHLLNQYEKVQVWQFNRKRQFFVAFLKKNSKQKIINILSQLLMEYNKKEFPQNLTQKLPERSEYPSQVLERKYKSGKQFSIDNRNSSSLRGETYVSGGPYLSQSAFVPQAFYQPFDRSTYLNENTNKFVSEKNSQKKCLNQNQIIEKHHKSPLKSDKKATQEKEQFQGNKNSNNGNVNQKTFFSNNLFEHRMPPIIPDQPHRYLSDYNGSNIPLSFSNSQMYYHPSYFSNSDHISDGKQMQKHSGYQFLKGSQLFFGPNMYFQPRFGQQKPNQFQQFRGNPYYAFIPPYNYPYNYGQNESIRVVEDKAQEQKQITKQQIPSLNYSSLNRTLTHHSSTFSAFKKTENNHNKSSNVINLIDSDSDNEQLKTQKINSFKNVSHSGKYLNNDNHQKSYFQKHKNIHKQYKIHNGLNIEQRYIDMQLAKQRYHKIHAQKVGNLNLKINKEKTNISKNEESNIALNQIKIKLAEKEFLRKKQAENHIVSEAQKAYNKNRHREQTYSRQSNRNIFHQKSNSFQSVDSKYRQQLLSKMRHFQQKNKGYTNSGVDQMYKQKNSIEKLESTKDQTFYGRSMGSDLGSKSRQKLSNVIMGALSKKNIEQTDKKNQKKIVFIQWNHKLKRLRQVCRKRQDNAQIMVGPQFQADMPPFIVGSKEARSLIAKKKNNLLSRLYKSVLV